MPQALGSSFIKVEMTTSRPAIDIQVRLGTSIQLKKGSYSKTKKKRMENFWKSKKKWIEKKRM